MSNPNAMYTKDTFAKSNTCLSMVIPGPCDIANFNVLPTKYAQKVISKIMQRFTFVVKMYHSKVQKCFMFAPYDEIYKPVLNYKYGHQVIAYTLKYAMHSQINIFLLGFPSSDRTIGIAYVLLV